MRSVIKIVLCAVVICAVIFLLAVLQEFIGLGRGTIGFLGCTILGVALPAIWKYNPDKKQDRDDTHTLNKN